MNPQGVLPFLQSFLEAVLQWNQPSPSLNQIFKKVLDMFKEGMGVQVWETEKSKWSLGVRKRLHERYGL
jgi:transportin-1